MKKTITFFGVLFVGLINANAQITLDETNLPHGVSYTENRDYILNGIALPQEGANQLYDYGSLSLPTTRIVREYFPVTRPEFAASTRYFLGIGSVGPIQITGEYYTVQNSEGRYDTGAYVRPSSQSLQTSTGDPNDFIEFPGNAVVFPEPAVELLFPASFGNNAAVSSSYDFTTEFELTVNAFGLNATPGQNVQSVVKTIEIVGYGQLTLPLPSGQSAPIDVLLVKHVEVAENNVFLGGQPAPQPLLDAFGVTQGQVDTLNASYKFYAENYDLPVLTILMNEDFTEVYEMYYDIDLLETLGLTDNAFSNNITLFPNPAQGKISIVQDNMQASINQVIIYDLSGKEVKSIEIQNVAVPQIDIDVNDLINGVYFVKVNSNGYAATKRLIISK